MNIMRKVTPLFIMVAFSLFATATQRLNACADGLKIYDNPGGGQIVYGPLDGKPSLQQAMGEVLRNVHGHFGDRPQVGRFFQTKGTSSVATFFTLTAKNEGGKRIAGLAIVNVPADSQAAAAVIYDDASRFGTTANVMLKKLSSLWSPAPPSSPSPTGSAPLHESAPPPLHPVHFADNSGVISLPSGWQITSAGGGTVHVAGPHGEAIHLGVIDQGIYDLRYPGTQGLVRYLAMGHRPYYLCPKGGDLVNAYKVVSQQIRHQHQLPDITMDVISSVPLPANSEESAVVQVLANMDLHDGKGILLASLRIGALRSNGGQWAMTVSGTTIPKQQAEEEWPTVRAIVSSYRQNAGVIQHQTDEIIAQIHRSSDAAKARMDQFHASNDQRNAAIDKTRDDQSRASASFQNYQFDQSVVQDNRAGEHSTFDNRVADSLVKMDPNRYQYVKDPDFVKGIDY
jgi:hypothetical protein